MLPEAKIRGYKPGRFSFNVKGGRCEECQGGGMKLIEMNFLPDVYVHCDKCNGKRYNRETLEVRYRGNSISDVLDMTINQAVEFFENMPKILQKLKTLQEVGLGYLTLGQSSTTISGGEAQRVKLATELSKRDTGKTLYILDEPTTGLHFEDIRVLLEVLNRLVDKGNTVVVIEHNMDVIKVSDHLIDIGPEGGRNGGMVVAEGTPEEVAANNKSITGKYLAQELK
jgi:excinuclease ABC subunit A